MYLISDGSQVLEEPEVRQEAQRQPQAAASTCRQERRIQINSFFQSDFFRMERSLFSIRE